MSISISRRAVMQGTVALSALPMLGRRAFAADKIKVAGVHASPVENAWNSRVHLALNQAAKDGLIDYVFSEGVSATDYPRAMREYADQGIPLIWGESYAVENEARQVAKDYPKTAFLMGSSGGPQGDNFGVFGTRNHESCYLAGMLAAKLSKSGTFGAVGGYPIPEVNLVINAFRNGVRELRPDAKFLVGFIGTWFDPAKAKEAALAQIDAGADVLMGERIGTADACKDRNVKAIGSLTDFGPQYPGVVFASAVWNFLPTVKAIVADVQGKKPVGRDYTEYSFMKNGGNELVYSKDGIPADALAAMEAKKADIVAGKYEVAVDTSEPK